jgi:hypothetical protein
MQTWQFIEALEANAVAKMGSEGLVTLPIPSIETQDQLEKLGVTFGDPVDAVQVSLTLPKGWKLQNASDRRHRTLMDDTGQPVASVFLKNSGYDYYGSMRMLE